MIPSPRYLALLESGKLEQRVQALERLLSPCRVCPRACGADRRGGAAGRCGVGRQAHLAAACLHRGEEPVISGTRGAGTLFFGGCNLRCVFCQNHEISQPRRGAVPPGGPVDAAALADAMLALQTDGAHNVELVSPSHVVPQVAAALCDAAGRGLRLPVVYNSNGYEGLEALRLLDGLVDVYLPDLKYGRDALAARYSAAPAYLDHARAALAEMQRQVGDLVLDEDGLARRGLLVRHLVLPNDLAATRAALGLIAADLGPATHVSIMAQYYPAHHAPRVPLLSRPLSAAEYAQVLDWLEEVGLEHGFVQDLESQATYRPEFARAGHPFERPLGAGRTP